MPNQRDSGQEAGWYSAHPGRARQRRQTQLRRLAVVAAACGVAVGTLSLPRVAAVITSAHFAPQPGVTTTTPTSTTLPVNPNTRITVAAVGDTMMGSPQFGLPPADGKDLFSATEQYLRAEISIVDQEGTLTSAAPTKCGAGSTECFAFATPPGYAANLSAAGFNVANLANNHTDDAGATGLNDTVAALTSANLAHTGLPGQFTIRRVGLVKVAVLGFAPYTWCANSLNLSAVTALVRRARVEANVVIVYFHAGAQGADEIHVSTGPESVFGDPQGNIRVLAHTFVDAGADMVIGTGPHVLRGIQFYKGKMIDYSLGNFLGYKGFGLGGNLSTSAVLQATITASGRFVSARLRPVELDGDGVPSPGGSGIALVKSVSASDFGASAAQISADGQVTPPSQT